MSASQHHHRVSTALALAGVLIILTTAAPSAASAHKPAPDAGPATASINWVDDDRFIAYLKSQAVR
jgi:hypothetical protein